MCVLLTASLWVAAGLAAPGSTAPAAPSLTADGDPGAGYVRLEWTPVDGALGYELQAASGEAFDAAETLYKGEQRASFLSGLPDGARFFRVRGHLEAEATDWSEPVRFDVTHHGLPLAGGLFVLGLLVFGTTAGFLVREARRDT